MQVSLNQGSLQEYLSIIKTFMLEMHQRVNEECEFPSLESQLISIVDQASIKLKTQKEHIDILQKQLKESEIAKINFKEIKGQYSHLQKRLNQKVDEISILRETVKTLYRDNQRISGQKEGLNKQISSLKQSSSSMRKKLKKQEEQISNHRAQLKKLTNSTEQRLAEYLKDDEQKQITIKKLSSQVDRLKADNHKKDKNYNNATKKIDELQGSRQQLEKSLKLIDNLKQQNHLLLTELQAMKEKYFDEKAKMLKDYDSLKHQNNELRERIEQYKYENKELISKMGIIQQKNVNYENQIIMRTQKLKQKTKQAKTYSQQVSRLSKRIEQLSRMSDEIITENQELNDRCNGLESQLEEVKALQGYIAKIKGDINTKKTAQLNKLIESLGKLHSFA